MKQKYWIIVAVCAFIGLAVLSIVLSNRQQQELKAMSEDITDMSVKVDELELQVESLNSQSRVLSSAIKEDEQIIKDLENGGGPSDSNENGKDTVNLVWVLYSEPSKLSDWPEVEEALNAYSAEKISVTCNFVYKDKDELGDTILDGHEYDIVFTCNWWNDFAKNVGSI